MARITVRDLRKEFGTFTAVKESSFTIEDGEFFMLLGPSGCGKTTTLRMIAGLKMPTSETIHIDGEDVSNLPASRRDIAFVSQMFALYPPMNARRNISDPLVSQGLPRAQVAAKVAEVARILGIESILDRPVGGLSGGDRQRVALGCAIVRSPEAFMMDEPPGALDAGFRERMAEGLRALHDRMGATTVHVTHDQLEAMRMGDKIAVMNGGLEQLGTPREVHDHPATLFVADFIGSPPMNVLPLGGFPHRGLREATLGQVAVPVPTPHEGGPGGTGWMLGMRPEHVILGDVGAHRARVEAVEYLGTTQMITLSTPEGPLKARVPAGLRARVGETVSIGFDAARLTLFDAATGRALRTEANAGPLHG